MNTSVSCVGAWYSYFKQPSWDNAALAEWGREKIFICNTPGSDSDNILWCELCCSCTIWATIWRSEADLASPSCCRASVGMHQGRRTTPLGWAGIHFDQTQLLGWVPAALHIVCALPTAATTPADKSSHNLSEAEFAATHCFFGKKPQHTHFKVASWWGTTTGRGKTTT